MNIAFAPMVPKRDWLLLCQHVPLRWSDGTKGIVAANIDTQELVGGIVFQDWTRSSVQVHQWLDSPWLIRHGIYNEVCNYVFNDCGLYQMIGLVSGKDERTLRYNKKLGFEEAFRIENGWDMGVDQVIMIGTRDNLARWTPGMEQAA